MFINMSLFLLNKYFTLFTCELFTRVQLIIVSTVSSSNGRYIYKNVVVLKHKLFLDWSLCVLVRYDCIALVCGM